MLERKSNSTACLTIILIIFIICLCSVTLAAIGGLAWAVSKQNQQDKNIMAKLNDLLAAVKANNDAADSLIVLTTGIKARLDEVLAGGLTPEQQTAVNTLFDEVETQKAEIIAAIAANTTPPTP